METCIITGGNNGIGFDTARKLLNLNFDVVLACRNDEKGRRAVKNLKKNNLTASVSYMHLDLASKASIECFVEMFNKSKKKLKLLINNAGINFSYYSFYVLWLFLVILDGVSVTTFLVVC